MRTSIHRDVMQPSSAPASPLAPQRILNGEFHDWYRIVLGYSDHLVSGLIDDFSLKRADAVLDPFCGTGTTLVECMKRGLHAVGVDANPSSCFAASVKTTWGLDRAYLLTLLKKVQLAYERREATRPSYQDDVTYDYIVESGMLDRGWISPVPLRKAIALKRSILAVRTERSYRAALALALIAEVVQNASNVKFGPELYCSYQKDDVDVLDGFTARVKTMASDLSKVVGIPYGRARVVRGDSRRPRAVVGRRSFDAVICSPPYPTEHDYTRNSRLELAFLESVFDDHSLRAVKQQMIRSHTKGIYAEDRDSMLVSRIRPIESLASEIEEKAKNKKHGFARLYGTVVREYFGGMRRHFRSIAPLLARNANCAYVVGDQASYLQVHIPTAELLADLAEREGFKVVEIRHWRGRRSTTTSKTINENVLVLRKAY